MQQMMQDEAGNVFEVDAAGNPIRMVTPAATGRGRVFSLPQNPKEIRQEARQDNSDARANAAAERAADAAARDAENDATANRIRELEIRLKEQELETGDKGTVAQKDRFGRLNALTNQIRRVRQLYNTGPGTTKGVAGLQDYAPTNENAQFDAAGASLSAQGLAAFRTPGSGTVSDRDAIMFDRANLPTAATRDLAIEEQLRGLQSRVEEEYRTLGKPVPNWNDVDASKPEQKADNELPDPTTGANLKPPAPGLLGPGGAGGEGTMGGPAGGPGGGGLSVASGDTREVLNERLSSQVDAMVNAGASLGMINAVMKRQGKASISPASYTGAKAWMKANPGKRYYGAQITDMKDMTALQKVAGSDTGAFVAQMTNAATAGIPAALAGPSGQGALDAMAVNSPNASLGGQLIGGVAGALGGEAAVAARAPAALARYAPAIADTLFGSLTGFNSAKEGEGAKGALIGAGAGLAGNLVGQGLVRGVGAVSRGVQSPPARYLRDQGIPLTVGQTVGDSGRIGSGVKKIEDALTSVPFVGSMVDARRMEGLEGFNRAAFEAAAAPQTTLTATGAQGLGELRQGVQDAYGRALDPVRIDPTEGQFGADVGQAINAAQAIPNVNSAQDAAMAGLQTRLDGAIDPATAEMSGRGFQEAYRGLARTGRERANSDYGHEVGQVMRQGQDALASALERQNPGAFDEFLEANAANRRMNVLASALKPAGNQADELITPAQLNRADIQSTSRLEGQVNSAAGNRPFYDLATAGQNVLPSKLPDTGTATRALIGGGLTGVLGGGGAYAGGTEGAAVGTGGGLAAMLLAAAGGSRFAQRHATTLLMERPELAITFGNILRQQAQIGGAVGSGVATQQAVGY